MNLPSCGASTQLIRTRVSHRIRTATFRDDLVGWLMAGRKRLATPAGEIRFGAGQVFLIPRATQWDLVNEAAPGGVYEARLIGFAPPLIERFHQRFGQFAGVPALQGAAGTAADAAFAATFEHASAALREEPDSSEAMREHRALELLLLLAERGLVFAPARGLAWADRVQRLVGQRPQADWTVEALARAFHLSASTLQRRLAEEGSSVSRCVREVRLEAALALLQQGSGLQVSEIAARCGYDSHSRFSAAFRQRFGFAPSDLRP
ncbi:helix-turn-helix transcriptional regulator [Roseateles sp. DAIF2]|uniref:helix-turn-helix transcriptional regulator n=1 Tax=Roseateles sp. DAIF2 TaxID=2714952 RepID=UPI0018A2D01E|nr:helix-turn-helix transcriptional regulator [Roseateles sp. DAIF2]QPF71578.1 helix-turn-helix transcriptional regulator [Roseateles sp. DAIF2]